MKAIAFLLFAVVFHVHAQIPSDSLSQLSVRDSLFLRVVIPERDTIRSGAPRQRIAASTVPSAKAFINGREAKVYPSGAFVGLVDIAVGTNPLRLVVKTAAGDSLWKDYIVERPEPIKSSPREPVVIDSVMMEPLQDLWLGKGDILEVKFKGSPGYEASFEIEDVESGIPMRELTLKEAGGLEGIYIGRYKVRETDEARDARICFKLKKSFWSSEKAYAKARVSVLPTVLPLVAEVQGHRPFLNVGLGVDRLGGAKLGHIQGGIRVAITGKVGRQYRLRLSESLDGWLPEDFARLLPEETPMPRSLVGSLSATGTMTEDVVTVSLNQRLPYLSEQLVNPNRIVVDIFGATSNTNWITHHLSATGIQNVSWEQVSTDQYRLIILLKHTQHWGYDVGYNHASNLRVRVRRPPIVANRDSILSGLVIAVDAGHGGGNEGAVGATGVREKNVTIAVVRQLEDQLKGKGATVVLTRKSDEGPGMTERMETVVSSGAQILVSIHCNSIGGTSDPEAVRGTSTYYRHVGFQPLASVMYDRMLELGLAQFGVVGSFNFALNAPTQLPNVLVETAFLSNPEDEMKLIDEDFRKQMAEKIVEGLEKFVRQYGTNEREK